MKYLGKLLFIIVIISIFVSCTKENKTVTEKGTTVGYKQQASGGNIGKVVNMGGDDCCLDYTTKLDISSGEWCCNSGTNCAACVTITGSAEATLDDLVNSGASSVADYFSGTEWDDIFPELGNDNPSMLSKLQSGDYSLEKLYDLDINKIIYKASNSEGDFFGLPTIKE